jgi:hypothetical protein
MGMDPTGTDALMFLALALAGEIDEFANLIKKHLRDGRFNRQEMAGIRSYLLHLED